MKTQLVAAALGLLLLCGTVAAQEKVPCPSDEALYFFRAELNQVVDARTVALDIDLGFRVWLHKTQIRLSGIEALDKSTPEGQRAMEWLTGKLRDASDLGELRIKTFPAPRGSDIPWIGVLFAAGKDLNQEMIAQGLVKAAKP